MAYEVMIIAAHPDDAEVQMGGTIVKLIRQGYKVLIVDLCDGEPADFADPGVRREQAMRAAEILGADRLILNGQDRLIEDKIETRLEIARLIREHRPRWVFGTSEACIHPDHAAVEPIVTAAVFYARLGNWDRAPGRPHCWPPHLRHAGFDQPRHRAPVPDIYRCPGLLEQYSRPRK